MKETFRLSSRSLSSFLIRAHCNIPFSLLLAPAWCADTSYNKGLICIGFTQVANMRFQTRNIYGEASASEVTSGSVTSARKCVHKSSFYSYVNFIYCHWIGSQINIVTWYAQSLSSEIRVCSCSLSSEARLYGVIVEFGSSRSLLRPPFNNNIVYNSRTSV
jgi:hypothetical protein